MALPTWNRVRKQIHATRDQKGNIDFDGARRKKYKALAEHTGRPLVVYATAFLVKGKVRATNGDVSIDNSDIAGFLEVTRELESENVDVLIFSPGGIAEATDSIVAILRDRFKHIRFIVPSMAKSAATMLALSGDELLMDSSAELGPIDPQFHIPRGDGSVVSAPAQAIIDQFEDAKAELAKNPKLLPAWIPILQQYGPALHRQCKNSIELSKDYVREWLKTRMFADQGDAAERAARVVDYIGDHNAFKTHGARVGIKELKEVGVPVTVIDADPTLHALVLEAFLAVTITLDSTAAFKLFENSEGAALVRLINQAQVQIPIPTAIKVPKQPGAP